MKLDFLNCCPEKSGMQMLRAVFVNTFLAKNLCKYLFTTCVALLIANRDVKIGVKPVYSFMFISKEKFILSSPKLIALMQ